MNEQNRFYRGIQVVPKHTSSVERERGHQRLNPERLTGRLSFDLVTWQPLHVGSGVLQPPEALALAADVPLVKAFFRADDALTLPGSSLKGAVRSLVELFTHSCVSKTGVRWRRDEQDDYRECRYQSKRHQGQICPVCKLFGAMGYQGQVRFGDAPQIGGDSEVHDIPPQYRPRANKAYRRYYPYDLSDDRERTWPLETATIGSRFAAQGRFTNLTPGELGLLLVALGQGTWQLCPRLGAGKSSGLGGVQVDNLLVERWSVSQAYRTLDSDVWQVVDVAGCLAAAQPLLRDDVLNRLARDLSCSAAGGG
jgi:hypothetical protein